MNKSAFLSVRVPEETRRRVKEIAARKGTTVQELIRRLVDDLIDREARARPSLTDVVTRLRVERERLEGFGVAHVDLFGSVVRGEADEESDIDVAVEFKRRKGLSLTRFASLQSELENILGHKVDVSERQRLKPSVRRGLDRDAVRVF